MFKNVPAAGLVSCNLLKIVFMPRWLENPLAAAGAKLDVLTDLKKLSSILSKEDVAFYLQTQDSLFRLLSAPVCETLQPYSFQDQFHNGALPEQDAKLILQLKHCSDVDTGTPEEVVRAFMGDNYCPHIDSKWVNFMLTAEMLDHETIVVRMVENAPTEKTEQLLGYFYEQLLKLTYMFHPFDRVANTPLFKAYLELMNRKIQQY